MKRGLNSEQIDAVKRLLSDAQADLFLALNRLPLPIKGEREVRSALEKIQQVFRVVEA